jgi:endonuclease/exonuclease/phosphatase family metal-dependent hydrolase
MLEAVIDTPVGPIRIYSVHLSHLCEATRLPQIAAIQDILKRAPSEGGAWCGGHPDPASGWVEEAEPPMPRSCIIMGDFNCGPSTREYAALIGDVAPGYGRLTNREGLLDAWVVAGNDEATGSTHPNAKKRIDHALISADLAQFVTDVRIDDAAQGSDHWPVWVDFKPAEAGL